MKSLKTKIMLAISEVHSGNGTEGEQIADAVLSVIAHLAEDEAVVERVGKAMFLDELKTQKLMRNPETTWQEESEIWLSNARAALRTLAGKE